jgi:hypothetical protein
MPYFSLKKTRGGKKDVLFVCITSKALVLDDVYIDNVA